MFSVVFGVMEWILPLTPSFSLVLPTDTGGSVAAVVAVVISVVVFIHRGATVITTPLFVRLVVLSHF